MIKKIVASFTCLCLLFSAVFVSENLSIKAGAALPNDYRKYDFTDQKFYDDYTEWSVNSKRNFISKFNESAGISLAYGKVVYNTTLKSSGIFFGSNDNIDNLITINQGLISFPLESKNIVNGKSISICEISGEAYLAYDYKHTNRDGNAGGITIPVAVNDDGWVLANVYHIWSAEGIYDSSNKLIETTGSNPQLSAQAAVYNTTTSSLDSSIVSGTPNPTVSDEDSETIESITYISNRSQKVDFKVTNSMKSSDTIEYTIKLTTHLECSVTPGATSADTVRDVTWNISGSVKTSDVISNKKLGNMSFSKPIFGIGGFYNHGTTVAGVKNVKLKYDFSELGEYINSQIENTEMSNLTLAREDEIVTLYKKFIALSDVEKAKVTRANQQKILNAYTQIQDLISAEESELSLYKTTTFENGEQGERCFIPSTGFSIVKNDYTDVINSSKRVMAISTSNNNPVAFKTMLLDGTKQLATFSGKVYVSTSSNNYIIYDYQSDTEWKAIRFYVDPSFKGYCARLITFSDGKLTSGSRYNFSFYSGKTVGYKKGWMDFAFEYSLTEVKLTVRTECDKNTILLGNCAAGAIKLLDTNYVKVGFAGFGDALVDDLNVTFMGTSDYIAAKGFTKKYQELINLIPASTFVSTSDEEQIQKMRAEYDALSDEKKCGLPFMDIRISDMENAVAALKSRTDYEQIKKSESALQAAVKAKKDPYVSYSFTEDFEDGLRSFKPAITGTVGDKTYIVFDERFQSNALLLKPSLQTITLKNSLIPGETPQVSSFSFKMHGSDDYYSWSSSLWVPLSYQPDGKDFFCYGWYMNDDKKLNEKYLSYHKYISKSGSTSITPAIRDNNLHWGDILTVEAQFDVTGKCILNISDEHNGTETLTYSSADLDSIFAIINSYNEVYVDDLTITYRTGSYTKDIEVTDINVYYAGNTTLNPGDIAYINGEAIANNVSSVEILRLPDDHTAVINGNGGFINQTSYSYDGVHAGEYLSDPVNPYWDDNQAIIVSIIQKTVNSIKFKIPENIQKGIYAVKLWDSAYESSKIIYLNAPKVTYTIGKDGGELTDKKESCGRSAPGEEIRVIGNFFSLGDSGENILVKLVNIANANEKYILDSSSVEVQSDNSLSVKIPAEISVANGKKVFELSVHSGFGNDTAWSRPVLITVQPDLRSEWKNDVFNVADYGADGSNTQNATPYFVDALSAISQNGGGILYLPKGTYRIQSSLIIPENVQIIGEEQKEVIVLFVPYDLEYNNFADDYLLKFTKNISIENITFLGSRIPGFLYGYGESSDNVYLKNIKLHFEPLAGAASQAPHGFNPLVSAAEQQLMLYAEKPNYIFSLQNRGSNVRMENMDLSDVRTMGASKIYNYKNGSYYWYVANNVFDNGRPMHNTVIAHYSIQENNEATLVLWGEGVYTANNNVLGTTQNNREGWVADHGAEYAGIMTPVNNTSDNRFFYLTTVLSSNCTEFAQVYVRSGQGVGQTRRVISSRTVAGANKNYTLIEVDRPFIVMPNSNSKVVIRRNRQSLYFVNNKMKDCAAGFAFYGGCCDVVYDSNVYNGVYGIYNMGIFSDVNWYVSYNNEEINYSPTLLNIYGVGGRNGYYFLGTSGENAQVGFTVKNCTLNGQYVKLQSGGNRNLVDFIFDNNEFYDLDYAYESVTAAGVLDGFYFTRNKYFNVKDIFDPNSANKIMLTLTKETNEAGGRYWIVKDNQETVISKKLGDVNGDGKITIKDATLIKYYVVGKIALSEDQLKNANVNGDNVVDIRDASMIVLYLIGKIDYSAFVGGSVDTDNDNSDISSEDTSSEDTSSSESSSAPSESSLTPIPDESGNYTPWH